MIAATIAVRLFNYRSILVAVGAVAEVLERLRVLIEQLFHLQSQEWIGLLSQYLFDLRSREFLVISFVVPAAAAVGDLSTFCMIDRSRRFDAFLRVQHVRCGVYFFLSIPLHNILSFRVYDELFESVELSDLLLVELGLEDVLQDDQLVEGDLEVVPRYHHSSLFLDLNRSKVVYCVEPRLLHLNSILLTLFKHRVAPGLPVILNLIQEALIISFSRFYYLNNLVFFIIRLVANVRRNPVNRFDVQVRASCAQGQSRIDLMQTVCVLIELSVHLVAPFRPQAQLFQVKILALQDQLGEVLRRFDLVDL